jgi:hypothetical protein
MIALSRFRIARPATLATVLMGIVLGSACVPDQDYLIVERAVWFDDRDTCLLGDETPVAMSIDVSFASPIGMGFLITNNQTSYKNSSTGIDDSEVVMQTADVSLSFSGGAVEGGSFTVTVPSNSVLGGESEPFLIQIPASVNESLRTTMASLPPNSIEVLEMEVIFHARRSNQAGNSKLGSITTRPYVFPFDVCFGCLAYCAAPDECSGMETCPTITDWKGTCGFAQGLSIIQPQCAAPE